MEGAVVLEKLSNKTERGGWGRKRWGVGVGGDSSGFCEKDPETC